MVRKNSTEKQKTQNKRKKMNRNVTTKKIRGLATRKN